MKQLTCEMCGSTNLIKQDGLFVCQTCGTKYSVEEARKMMIEGQVDVSGSTVKVDRTENVQNYLMMAKQAYDSGNKAEAETYCNKIIENSPDNYEAWLLKGKAAGWQSTAANIRLDQTVSCFSKALENAPEDKVEELKKDIASETSSLLLALTSLFCDHYEGIPDAEHASKIISSLTLMYKLTIDLLVKCNVKPNEMKKSAANRIYNAVLTAWNNTIYAEYKEDSNPSKYKWDRFVARGDAAIILLNTVISTRGEDDPANASVYSFLIIIQNALINSSSYTYSSASGGYIREYMLNDANVQSRRSQIREYHKAWNKIDSSHAIPTEETIMKSAPSAKEAQAADNKFVVICVIIIIAFCFLMSAC